MKNFETSIDVRWSDCDPNNHVRHSSYYDYGAHARIQLFIQNGFDPKKMTELGIGPILFKEECSFIREIRPNDNITINILKDQISEDGGRWMLHHEIINQHGEKNAHITVKGAWIDLHKRKLTLPPAELAEVIHDLPKGEAYSYKKS